MKRLLLSLGAVTIVLGLSVATAQQPKADNTQANKGDQSSTAATADHSKNNSSDLQLARNIRREVVKDKALSTYAHNVKIIAQDGKVTIKGPVKNAVEQKAILEIAQRFAGEDNVTNQITLKGEDNQ